jgi:hypothetical protein
MAQIVAHCFSLVWQETLIACSLALLKVGINIDIKRAIIEITTRSSINVNPLDLFILLFLSLFLNFKFLCRYRQFRLDINTGMIPDNYFIIMFYFLNGMA